MDRGRRMLPGLGVALAALALAWSSAEGGEATPRPRSCVRAGLVDGQLRCDDELPRDPAALCTRVGQGPGPRATAAIAAGDALDTAQLCARSAASPYTPEHGWSRMPADQLAALGQPVDVNRATLAELESLPRIGPALARRIVEGRPFADVDELQRVRGIGPATLRRLRDRALVIPPPAP